METLHTTDAAPSPPSVEQDAMIDTPESNPLLQSAGTFQDDPFWDEMLDSIRRHRREMDAQWDVPE